VADESIIRTVIGAAGGIVGMSVGAFFRFLGDRGTQQLIIDQGKRIAALEEAFRTEAVEKAELRKENELLKRWVKYLREKVVKLETALNEAVGKNKL
jgi:hypothetical protein